MASQPYTVRLDADTARELAIKGVTILLLDVPEGTLVGIDQQIFFVGPNFKGVKMVPPGVHVVSYAAAGAQGGFGPTTAFFLHARGGEVAAWRWDASDEVLNRIEEEGEAAALTAAVKAFQLDASLAPYDLASYPTWRQLAGHITVETIDRVAPLGGNMNVLAEPGAGSSGGARPTAAEEALEDALARGRAERAEKAEESNAANPAAEGPTDAAAEASAPHAGRCYFTPLPRLVKRPGLSPAELTALNLDKSSVLEEVLSSRFSDAPAALLGEFQFAFLAFLLGHSMAGFSQWKNFLRLLLGCEAAALGPRALLFTDFLRALHAQLMHSLGGGMMGSNEDDAENAEKTSFGAPFVEELLEDSFLRRLTSGWLRWVAGEPSAPAAVASAAADLAKLLRVTVGWECGPVQELGGGGGGGGGGGDSDEEEDDDGPVVVDAADLPPGYLESL